MPEFHLISHHLCPYVQRAVIVLNEKQIAHRRSHIDRANKPGWFVDISPLGRVPVLQVDDAILFESQVIAEYLDEITDGSLHPDDPLEKARHRAWIEFGSQTLNAIGAFYNAGSAEQFEDKRLALAGKFRRIENEIVSPFFAGATFQMIDGVWGTIFRYLDVFDQIGDYNLLENSAVLARWRTAIMGRPSVASAAPAGYGGRLMKFLKNRNSHISSLI